MEPQAYKVVNTYAHKISGCTILSIIIHARSPHPGRMNGDFQYDLATLAFKNGEILNIFISEFSDFNSKLSSMKNCIHYNTSLPLHEGVVK